MNIIKKLILLALAASNAFSQSGMIEQFKQQHTHCGHMTLELDGMMPTDVLAEVSEFILPTPKKPKNTLGGNSQKPISNNGPVSNNILDDDQVFSKHKLRVDVDYQCKDFFSRI